MSMNFQSLQKLTVCIEEFLNQHVNNLMD